MNKFERLKIWFGYTFASKEERALYYCEVCHRHRLDHPEDNACFPKEKPKKKPSKIKAKKP